MIRFVLKRLCFSIPLLLGMPFIVLLLIHLAPGGPLDEYKINPQISAQTIKLYEDKFGLNKPVVVQYFLWLKNILRGDFGYSFSYKVPVAKVISSRALNTLILSLATLIVSWIFVIPLGVLTALKRNKLTDRIISFFSYLGISSPNFLLAFVFLYLATFIKWLPLGGMRSVNFEELNFLGKIFDVARHLIIPTLILSIGNICVLQRIMRANLLEVLGSYYILGAKARGISNKRILYIHALKNALNPMITIFGYQFSALLSGAALTEIIVGWPGLGVVILEGFQRQDLYLVMGAMLMGGVLLVAGNLLADIMLAYFDPRIRYQER
jgi:peptide/nickel transport system permease protein